MNTLIGRYIVLICLFGAYINSHAQNCRIPGVEKWEDARVLCNIKALDGSYCSTPDTLNYSGPPPLLCFGEGVSQNTMWWAFVGHGSRIKIRFERDNTECKYLLSCKATEIQAGIIDDIVFMTPLDCNALCYMDTINLSGITQNCHTYYLWVDGCCGGICNFTIRIDEGQEAKIPLPLPDFEVHRDDSDCEIFEICIGDLGKNCKASIRWTMDGNGMPNLDDQQCFRFEPPDQEVEFCVTWTLGTSDSTCDERTKCFVFTPPDDTMIHVELEPEIVCFELHEGRGYSWHLNGKDTFITQSCVDPPCIWKRIDTAGRCIVYEKSILLLPKRKMGHRFILSLDDSVFIAEDGTHFDSTVCAVDIVFKDTVDELQVLCDTSYQLVYEKFSPQVTIEVDTISGYGGSMRILPSVKYDLHCLPGQLEWDGFWVVDKRDTIFQDTLLLHSGSNPIGEFTYYLKVRYTDQLHPESNTEGIYFTGKTFTIHDCLLYRPVAKNIVCSEENKIHFELDFSWFGMPGDSFYISTARKWKRRFAIANLPVRVVDFPLLDTDSIHTYEICAMGKKQCCVSGFVVKNCKKTFSKNFSEEDPVIFYESLRRRLFLQVAPASIPFQLKIYSLDGKIHYFKHWIYANYSYDLHSLSPGFYIAVLLDHKGHIRATLSFFHL